MYPSTQAGPPRPLGTLLSSRPIFASVRRAMRPAHSALGTAPPDLGRCTLRFYGESKSKVSFVTNFTAEWNHEEHRAEEPFKHALAARPVCALTLAPRATVTFVHMHSIANYPERDGPTRPHLECCSQMTDGKVVQAVFSRSRV